MIESAAFESLMHGVVLFFEAVGVAVIVGGFLLALFRAGRQHLATGTGAFETLRATFGRAILLGLEILIAADLVRTIVVELTLYNLGALSILVGIRTVLSLSLEVEIDGTWPWRRVDNGQG
ncbi:MAG: DUF1622 domain-containing protein [Anaerosomatales bacterium]|nr:DUF1622 domain-containing protein [Anaerosomatales bacterium]MDT8434252.1 DUF1622 domain-containing protein [Anaerosomatales bacterium]